MSFKWVLLNIFRGLLIYVCLYLQSAHLVGKIRVCAKLEAETDKKLQSFKQHNPKMQDGEALMNSLKGNNVFLLIFGCFMHKNIVFGCVSYIKVCFCEF